MQSLLLYMCDRPPYTHKSCQSPEKDSVSESQSNTLLNERYRILRPLGQGGFGKTFLAVDEKWQQNSTPGLIALITALTIYIRV